VVIVDMGVALGADLHVDQRVTGELVEHVIEEADASLDIGRTDAIEIHGNLDIRFVRPAGDFALPRFALRRRHLWSLLSLFFARS
jgi:hypothetical protein